MKGGMKKRLLLLMAAALFVGTAAQVASSAFAGNSEAFQNLFSVMGEDDGELPDGAVLDDEAVSSLSNWQGGTEGRGRNASASNAGATASDAGAALLLASQSNAELALRLLMLTAPGIPEPVRDFESLKQAVAQAEPEDEIVLSPGDYLFNETLEIGEKALRFTVKASGSNAVFKRAQTFTGTMIQIPERGALTLGSGLTMDGEHRENSAIAGTILTQGKLVMDGAVLQNEKHRGPFHAAPIHVEGSQASLLFQSGAIQNNDYSDYNTASSTGLPGIRRFL